MVHIGTTNTTKSRCVPAIALKASNYSGGYYFMNIFTGKKMNSYNWKEFTITEEIMGQVEKLDGYKGRPIMGDGYSFFELNPDIEINKTMENDEEENIMVSEEIQFQHEGNFVNTEIEECDDSNDDVNKEEIIEDDE